jgi:hypothetical protein
VPSRLLRLSFALVLVVVGLRWIVDSNPWSGPTVLEISASHGVHLNDWVSFACWALAVAVAVPGRLRSDGAVPVRLDRRR